MKHDTRTPSIEQPRLMPVLQESTLPPPAPDSPTVSSVTRQPSVPNAIETGHNDASMLEESSNSHSIVPPLEPTLSSELKSKNVRSGAQAVTNSGIISNDSRDGKDTNLHNADSELIAMLERVAANPDVSLDKLERLIAVQERILAHNAKAEFDAAYAQMQGEIPTITERGEISVNGQVRSRYATFEDIIEAVRPVLMKHGFALRHRTEYLDKQIKIVGILSHRSGHSEQDEFLAEADNSGSKNAIQALGSTRAYGQRYTTLALQTWTALRPVCAGAVVDGGTSS